MLQAFIPIYDQLAVYIRLLNVACFLYTLLYSFCFIQELAVFLHTLSSSFPGVACVTE